MNTYRSTPTILRNVLLAAIFLAGSLPVSVHATYDENYLMGNHILFYNPGDAGCAAGAAAKSYTTRLDIPSLVGNDNAEKIWRFLTSEGLSPEQAAGVMGNIQQESNFEPDLVEGDASAGGRTEKGYGIVQWTFERRTALEAAAKEQGVAVSDLGFQLAYMVQESKSRQVSGDVAGQGYGTTGENEWETLKKQKNVEDATVFWHNNFEVSADSPEKVLEVRGGFAQNAYESFKNLGAAAGKSAVSAASSAASCAAASGGGDLIQTLLAYAHPEYHDAPFWEPMPAYKKVATELSDKGLFVGGGKAEIGIPGIDCGGFVSVLLTQSGFEPDYNYGLDWGKGACNQRFPSICDSPAGEYGGQQGWAMKNWHYVGKGGDIDVVDLHPGDVAFSNGHTFLFVGQVDGFDGQFASASYSDPPDTSWFRAPMATGGTEDGQWGSESATNPEYTWYSKYPQPDRPGPRPLPS